MKAHINGTDIFFDVEGLQYRIEGGELREKPVCFLIHGGPGVDHTDYIPACSALAESMQVVYIDNRGSGRSGRPPIDTCTLEQNIEDIEVLRQYLGLGKVIIAGQSYGGVVAQGYAIQYPQNLSALILITTSPDCDFVDQAKEELERRGTPEQKQFGRHLFDGTFESDEQYKELFEKFYNLYSFRRTSPAGLREFYANVKVSHDVINFAVQNNWFSYHFEEGLKHVTVPALVIGGEHDWITPISNSYRIAEALPNSQLVVFQDASHSVFYDEPHGSN